MQQKKKTLVCAIAMCSHRLKEMKIIYNLFFPHFCVPNSKIGTIRLRNDDAKCLQELEDNVHYRRLKLVWSKIPKKI